MKSQPKIEKQKSLKSRWKNSRKRKNLFKETNAISREGCPLLSQTMPSIVLYSKKRETERWIGQGDFRTNGESIGRHHYSSLMVALSVDFYARLSVGSRQIVEIFNILNEFMGNVFGKVPAYTTIGYWTQELGLSVYKESCSLFKDKRYALIVDESMMIGSENFCLHLLCLPLMPVLQLRKRYYYC